MVRILFFAWIVVMVGCATPVETQFAQLGSQPLSQEPLSEKAYVNLDTGDDIHLDFSPESAPVRAFFGERSYTRGVELTGSGLRRIEIRCYMNGSAYAKKSFLDPTNIGQYFHPVILVLNESFVEVATILPRLEFVRGGLFGDRSDRLQGMLSLPAEARYLIFYTLPDLGADPAQRQGIQGYMIGALPMAVTYTQRFEFEPAPGGRVRLIRHH